MFPLKIKFQRELIVDIESKKIFDIIEKELIRLKIDEIELYDSQINFKNSLFNGQGRWHLMAPIDKGYFKLNKTLGTLEYSISVIRMFYITLSMSFFFGLISKSYWIGLFCFLWLFGMNMILTLIRHNKFMNKLKKIITQ